MRRYRGHSVVVAALLLASASAWAGRSPLAAENPVVAPIQPSDLVVELTPWVRIPDASIGRPRLNAMAVAGDRLFVVEQHDGVIYEVVVDGVDRSAVLFFDVGDAIEAATGRGLDTTNPTHGGLRSVAFPPDFEQTGRFYTSLMERRPSEPNPAEYLSDAPNPVDVDSVVVEWRVDPATGRPTPESHRQLFRVGMPVYDHPIKALAFDPYARPGDADHGLLYIAHGDGSVKSATSGGGQNNDALGKVLRIDPRPAGPAPYIVPSDNPFVGDPSMLDEVWSLGHRNPHQLAFVRDSAGDVHLVAAEPGRDNVEELNLIVPGGNYGWSDREGTFVHLPDGGLIDGIAPLPADDALNGYTYPSAQVGHDGPTGAGFVGQAIAGGYGIDNGSSLDGHYFYSDFPVSGRLFHSAVDDLAAAVTTLDPGDPGRDHPDDLTQATTYEPIIRFDDGSPETTAVELPDLDSVFELAADHDGSGRADVRFGQGPRGELYVTSKRNGWVYLVTNSLPPAAPGLLCRGVPVTVQIALGDLPTEHDDVILGTDGPDVVDGLGGDDRICGRGGDDVLRGGPGRDVIYGDAGDDVIDGGDGNDRLVGGDGDDELFGRGGRDVLQGGVGADTIEGGTRNDRLSGNGGRDRLHGGNGRDRVDGQAGADVVIGGGGNDRLLGGGGTDTLDGRVGVDSCAEGELVLRCELDLLS